MLGIAGMQVLNTGETDGELVDPVETVDGDGWCRTCGVRARSKGRRDTLVRDVAGRTALGCWKLLSLEARMETTASHL